MKQLSTLACFLLLAALAWSQTTDTTRLHAATRFAEAPHLPQTPEMQQGRGGASGDAPDFAGRCNNLPNLACGGFVSGNTAGANAFNANDYKLPFGGDYNGPDKAYKVTVAAQTSARFVLKIENSIADLDLILLKQCGDLGSQVVLAGYSLELNTSTGYYLEVLDLNLTAGNYVLVVDGKWSDQVGNFKVTMNCTCTCVEPDYDLPAGTKLLCDNFGDYQTNKALSPQSSRWGLFNNDGYQDNSRDALVRTEAGGNQYAQVNYYVDPTGAGNHRIANVLYHMDNRTNGRYRVSWRTWIEPNRGGLYYALHRDADSVGNDALMRIAYAVFFNPGGTGNLLTFPDPANANGFATPFSYKVNAWNDVVNIIDIDSDVAELWINDNFVYRWKFSTTKSDGNLFKRLSSFLFTGGKTSAGIVQDYRIDDLCVWQTTSPCPPSGAGPKVCVENKVDQIPEGTARCRLYTSDEWDECQSACEYGGTFAYRGITYKDTLYAVDLAPAFIRTDPCVVAAYGGTLPSPLLADVYIFKKNDDLDLNVVLSNAPPSCKVFVFSCYYKEGNQCISGQKCLAPSGNGGYSPLTCDSIYYIVVTGGLNSKYNLNIFPLGLCNPSEVTSLDFDCSIITGSPALIAPIQTAVSAEGVPQLSSADRYGKCYGGTRPYDGGERIFKFTLRSPAFVEMKLTSQAPMGMFLFNALCGEECERSAENYPPADSSITLSRLLLANDYYLIVDKATAGGDPNFKLEISYLCTSTNNVLPYLVTCSGNLTGPAEPAKSQTLDAEYCGCSGLDTLYQHIKINPDAYGFSPTHQVFFLARDTISHDFVSSSSMYANASTIINSNAGFLLSADKTTDTLKCAYAVGDTFFVMLINKGDGNQNYRFVNIRYAQSSAQSITVDTFKNAATSIIEKFTSGGSLNNVVFTTDISGLDPLAKDTSIRFRFYSNIPWKTKFYPDKPDWVTALSPGTSAAAGNLFAPEIKVSFPKNTRPKPRRVLIKFVSAAYPEFVYLYVPLEQGPDCILTPHVSIQTSAPAACLGDTLRLKAIVTDENGLDVSDAFTYTWSGGQKGQSFRDTLNSTGNHHYSVTASGQYCRDAGTSTSTSINVRDLPSAPAPLAGLTDRAACLGNSAALTVAHTPPGSNDIIWVENPTSTSTIFTGNAYTPPPPGLVGDYTFYARARNKSGTPQCYSPAIPATLSIKPLPGLEVVDKKCADILETTYSFKVLTATGNSLSILSGSGSIQPAAGGYIISDIPKGSDLRIRITDSTPQACYRDTLISGLPCTCQAPAKPVPLAVAPVCEGDTATFRVEMPTAPNVRVDWFAQASGGPSVQTNSLIWVTNDLKTYWAETYDTLTQCRSTERTRLDVTVHPKPQIEVLETPCAMDYLHYSLVIKRLPNVNFSIEPAVGNPPVLGADRITFGGIPEGTDLSIFATHAQTGCTSTLLLTSPECGCPLIDPPTGLPATLRYCQGATISTIEAGVNPGETADWLNADGDTLLLNSTLFQPADSTATYYVRARNIANGCTSALHEIKIVVHPLPTVDLAMPQCDTDLKGYSIEFSTTGSPTSPLPAGMLFSDGMGGYLISDIPKGQAISFVVSDATTTCSRTIQVAAPECTCASLPPLPPPLFIRHEAYCQSDTLLPALRVKVASGETADWYNASGSLEKSGDTLFVPPAKGTYSAVRRNLSNECVSATGTVVTLQENPLPTFTVTRKDCALDLATYSVTLSSTADVIAATLGTVSGFTPTYQVMGIPRDSAVRITATFSTTGCSSSQDVAPKQCDCTAFPVSAPSAAGQNPLTLCADTPLPLLIVSVGMGETATWYDSLGNVLATDTLRYQPASGGVYYVESRNRQSGCISDSRLAYRISINPLPTLELLPPTCNATLDAYTLLVKTNGKLSQPSPYIAINNGDGTYTIPNVDLGATLNLISTITATGCKTQQTYQKNECPCPALAPPQSLGNASACKDSPLPPLSVQVADPATETVDWYDETGKLLQIDALVFQPTDAKTATYFAQTRYKFSAECVSTMRTALMLTVFEPVVVQAGPDLKVCAGATIQLDGSISGGISTGAWSAPAGSFSPSATTLKATYLPPPGISSVALTLKSDDPAGPCPLRSDLLLIQIDPLPTFEEKARTCSPSLLQYQVEFAVPLTAQVSVNLSTAQLIGAGLYRVSGIPRDSNLQVLVKDPDTGCTAPFTVYTDGCPCPLVAAPAQPNNPLICPEDALPYLSVQVPPGQTADWYDAAGNLLKSDTLFFLPPGEGTYYAQAQVTVNQCTSLGTTPVTLTIKPSPVANAGPDVAICPGDSITLASAGQHDTYLWSTGGNTPAIRVSPPSTQLYILSVTRSQCADADTVRVTVRDSVVGSIELLSAIKCFGDANGQIRAIATGGTAPYKVLWSVMSGAPVLSNLAAGVYTATISDVPGCTDVVSYELTQPARLQIVTHTIQNETTAGKDGSIAVTVGGGTMPYTYQWADAALFNIPGATLSFLGGQMAGVYFVQVTDEHGCMLTDSFEIKKSSGIGLLSDPAAQVLLFPNPTDGHLSLSLVLPETCPVAVEISDLLGRVLLSSPAEPMQERHLEYDLSAYPAGPYLLRLRVGDEVFTRKVIVQR